MVTALQEWGRMFPSSLPPVFNRSPGRHRCRFPDPRDKKAGMHHTSFWPGRWWRAPVVGEPADQVAAALTEPTADVVLGGVPLATVLADADRCRAVATTLESVTLTLPRAGRVAAVLGRPDRRSAPVVILIHEWWGLTDQIKAMAAHLAEAGYFTLAVDLMDGRVATTVDDAVTLSARVNGATAREILVGWIDWARCQDQSDGQVGVLGWCFGGGLALMASLAMPVEATVIYCGLVMGSADTLSALKGPLLGHFGSRDAFVPANMVSRFAAGMKAAGREFRCHLYDAGHGFANPTGNHHHKEETRLAWRRTLAFLAETLKADEDP